MPSRRTKIRRSLLALLVSYLRESTIVTDKFTTVPGVAGAYPNVGSLWTFALGSELYQIAEMEASAPPLDLGVTLQIGVERADFSQSMPQLYTVSCGVVIRAPLSFGPGQESVSQQLAQKIDQALFRSNGRAEIKNYDVSPSVTTNSYVTWQAVPRGAWEAQEVDGAIEELRLAFDAQYSQPDSEW